MTKQEAIDIVRTASLALLILGYEKLADDLSKVITWAKEQEGEGE